MGEAPGVWTDCDDESGNDNGAGAGARGKANGGVAAAVDGCLRCKVSDESRGDGAGAADGDGGGRGADGNGSGGGDGGGGDALIAPGGYGHATRRTWGGPRRDQSMRASRAAASHSTPETGRAAEANRTPSAKVSSFANGV